MLNPELNFSLFQEAMEDLCRRYQGQEHGIEIFEVAGGYQFRTKPARADLAQKLIKIQTQRLSSGAMETLAIISYQQPVMKEEIDKIRGVDSSYFIRTLMDRKLIRISGRSELPGRPILYSTSPEFLEIFGLKDLSSLPPLRELEQMIPHSQSTNPADEDPRVREMRRLVSEMKSDQSSALYYNPKEDDKILKEIREKVAAIPSSTPYLDELKAAEAIAAQAPPAESASVGPPEETPPTTG
jgi:segregation and condensation protein B